MRDEQRVWDGWLAELPGADDMTAAELREAARSAAGEALRRGDPRADGLASDAVRAAGSGAVAAHLEREATRAVLRARYRRADDALGELTDADLEPAAADPAGWEEVHPRLVTGRLLTRAWCDRLLAELDRLRAWCRAEDLPPTAPNSMNRYGLLLDDLGLGAAADRLTREVLRPLAATHFADLGGADLDDPHAFLVEYGEDADEHLDFHVDDSEVTLNLCLGSDFSGSELLFQGLRCPAHLQTPCSPADQYTHAHAPGVALLHAGKHRHEAVPITGGRRVNLIVWCRSPSLRAAPRGGCPDWCRESRAR